MPDDPTPDLSAILKRLEYLEEKCPRLEAELARKDQIIAALQQRLFGKSSEKLDPNQLELLLGNDELMGKPAPLSPTEDEISGLGEEDEPSNPAPKKTRRKKRDIYPENLPVKVTQILIPEQVQANPEGYRTIGEEHSDELEIQPSVIYWKRTVRKKYVPASQDPEAPEKSAPLIVPAPAPSVPGTKIGPQLAAQIICDKYLYHLPLYRQTQRLNRRSGTQLNAQTIEHWSQRTAWHLAAIAQAIKRDAINSNYLQIDETVIRYLIPGTGKAHQGYFWVYLDPVTKNVVYDWQTSRAAACLNSVLTNPRDLIIQCDGYVAYPSFASNNRNVILGACLAHIRRKFIETKAHLIARKILNKIQQLYQIENQLRNSHSSANCRMLVRQAYAKPIVNEIKSILLEEQGKHLPSGNLGKAINYALGQWEGFVLYLANGQMEIDNNLVENAIRGTKLGHKNYLFFGSASAGKEHAAMYTLIENAKQQGLDPEKYLAEIIERLPENSDEETAGKLTPRAIAKEKKGLAGAEKKMNCA